MISDKKKLAAELLCIQAEERIKGERCLSKQDSLEQRKKLEDDCLYYWILELLQARMRGCVPAQNKENIKVMGEFWEHTNKVFLSQGIEPQYIPRYVDGREFFNVIQNTLSIFDEMENYSAKYFQTSKDSCEFSVYMSVKTKK